MEGAVPDGARGERLAGMHIGAHYQRVEHASGRPRIRQPLVAARRHTCQGERRAPQQARKPIRFGDVVQCVMAHPLRVAQPGRVNARAFDVFTVRRGQPEVARHCFEAVARQIAGGEVVPAHGVECVDQLAADHGVARGTLTLGGIPVVAFATPRPVAARRRAALQPGRTSAAERQRHLQRLSAPGQKWKVEAMQVVVLDHVGIHAADQCDQAADQVRFGDRPVQTALGAVEDAREAATVTHGHQKDLVVRRVESRRLQIELQAVHVRVGQAAKVGPARSDEILLFGGKLQRAILAQLPQACDGMTQARGGAREHRALELPPIGGADTIAQVAGATQLTIGDVRQGRLRPRCFGQPRAQMLQVVERG